MSDCPECEGSGRCVCTQCNDMHECVACEGLGHTWDVEDDQPADSEAEGGGDGDT